MELQQIIKLDNFLKMYAGGHIDERYYFTMNANESQLKDLLSFIIYLRANLTDHKNKNKIIAASVIHDLQGFYRKDKFFVPKYTGYSKTISITNL